MDRLFISLYNNTQIQMQVGDPLTIGLAIFIPLIAIPIILVTGELFKKTGYTLPDSSTGFSTSSPYTPSPIKGNFVTVFAKKIKTSVRPYSRKIKKTIKSFSMNNAKARSSSK